jgi:hypothetical protein
MGGCCEVGSEIWCPAPNFYKAFILHLYCHFLQAFKFFFTSAALVWFFFTVEPMKDWSALKNDALVPDSDKEKQF